MQIIHSIKSGISELDELTGGFFPDELTIVGAFEYEVAQAFFLAAIQNMIVNHTARTVIFPVFMPYTYFKNSLITMLSGVPIDEINNGTAKNTDVVKKAEKMIDDSGLIIGDIFETPQIDDFCDKLRQLVYENEQEQTIIFIERLWHLEIDKRPLYEILTELTMKLKALAQELSVPIVCILPLNFSSVYPEKNMRILRKNYGSSIEDNADVVIVTYKDKNQKDDNDILNRELIVAKNRDEKTGRCPFSFSCNWLQPSSQVLYRPHPEW